VVVVEPDTVMLPLVQVVRQPLELVINHTLVYMADPVAAAVVLKDNIV
jgi:hypothetical protein